MRLLAIAASITGLGVAGLLPVQGAAASGLPASPPQSRAASFAPVVIEWFSVVQPRSGQSLTVFSRFVNNNKPIPGAQMAATLTVGTQALGNVRGNATNAKGVARATFTVPQAASGKTLRVSVTLTYKKHTYKGVDTVEVEA